ncbi:MAG TPA: cobalamin-dependent protein [Candidatus Obscuribacterales bacterium]
MRFGMMYLKGKDYEDYGVIAPLAFGYLAAYLKQHLDFHDIFLEVDNLERIKAQSPDVIGISSFTETFEDAIRYSRLFKQLDRRLPIILGGEHISALPESLPESIDIGVIGEGEETIAELMALYQRNEATHDNLSKVRGIIYWHQGKQVITEPRPWIEDMDSIPMPDRELLLKDTKWQQPIFTARGCPYKCTFCASTKFWQRTRYHSVARVIEEIEYIHHYFPDQQIIPINDDLFPLNKKRMQAIVDGIRSKGLHKKVGFSLNARASVFDDEIAKMIVDMNGQVVCFGLESASDRILDALKGKTSARDNQRAIETCEKFNLPVVSNMMVGTPDEDVEDLARSYWFIRKNQYRFARPAIAYSTPYPGTGFWQEALRQGVIDEHFERWNILDLGYTRGESIYMNKHMDEAEFEKLYAIFKVFQAPLKTAYKHIYAWMAKRRYFEMAYPRLLEQQPLQGPVLEIGFEEFSLGDVEPGLEVTKVFIQKARADLSPLAGQRFATIVLSHALEKLRDPQALLQELHTHLAPGGRLLVLFYNAQHPHLLEQVLSGHWQPAPFGINHFHGLRFYSQATMAKLLQATGWQQSESSDFIPGDHSYSDALREAIAQLGESYPLPALNAPVSCLALASNEGQGTRSEGLEEEEKISIGLAPHP